MFFEKNDNNFLKLLLAIWFPFAIGSVDVISDIEIGGLSIQQLIILIIYLVGFSFLGVFYISVRNCSYVNYLWVSILLTSAVSLNGSLIQVVSVFMATMWASVLVNVFSVKDFIRYMADVSKMAIAISIVYSVIFFGLSFDYVNDVFSMSSFYDQKNLYGRLLLFSFLFHLLDYYYKGTSPYSNYSSLAWMLITMSLLMLSQSKTAIAISLVLALVFYPISKASQVSVRRWIFATYSIFISMIFLFVSLLYFGFIYFENLGSALDCLNILDLVCMPGTGRYTIWDSVIFDVYYYGKQVFGYGFGVYFSQISYISLSNIGLGSFQPNDPHNGYVDVFAALGFTGIILVLFMIGQLIVRSFKTYIDILVLVFFSVLLIVIYNWSESYFLKSTNFVIVLFFYIINLVSYTLRNNKQLRV